MVSVNAALEDRGKAPGNSGSKLSKKRKYPIKDRNDVNVRARRDKVELAEFTKLINRKNVRGGQEFSRDQSLENSTNYIN